jgi:hypothetical protein
MAATSSDVATEIDKLRLLQRATPSMADLIRFANFETEPFGRVAGGTAPPGSPNDVELVDRVYRCFLRACHQPKHSARHVPAKAVAEYFPWLKGLLVGRSRAEQAWFVYLAVHRVRGLLTLATLRNSLEPREPVEGPVKPQRRVQRRLSRIRSETHIFVASSEVSIGTHGVAHTSKRPATTTHPWTRTTDQLDALLDRVAQALDHLDLDQLKVCVAPLTQSEPGAPPAGKRTHKRRTKQLGGNDDYPGCGCFFLSKRKDVVACPRCQNRVNMQTARTGAVRQRYARRRREDRLADSLGRVGYLPDPTDRSGELIPAEDELKPRTAPSRAPKTRRPRGSSGVARPRRSRSTRSTS